MILYCGLNTLVLNKQVNTATIQDYQLQPQNKNKHILMLNCIVTFSEI